MLLSLRRGVALPPPSASSSCALVVSLVVHIHAGEDFEMAGPVSATVLSDLNSACEFCAMLLLCF